MLLFADTVNVDFTTAVFVLVANGVGKKLDGAGFWLTSQSANQWTLGATFKGSGLGAACNAADVSTTADAATSALVADLLAPRVRLFPLIYPPIRSRTDELK